MSETDTLEHIRKINSIRSQIEEYRERFIVCFEDFLNDITMENATRLYDIKQEPVARSAFNTYRDIRILHQITDIAAKELAAGYDPIINGSHSYKEAIDKYRSTVFMIRRQEFLTEDDDMERVEESIKYILEYEISPVAIHDIIENDAVINDIGAEDSREQINYWSGILSAAGRQRDALLLERM